LWRGAEMKAVSIAPINWSPVSLWASRTPLLLVVASVVILGLSTNEYQIFYQTHTVAGKDLIDASRGVLSGHPPWRAFQARLLGPLAFAGFEAVIEWGRIISPSAYSAFERVFSLPGTRDLAVLNAFVALMILAKNFVCFALLLRYSGSLIKAVGGTLLGTLLFVLLSNYWLYMWDLFELILFSFLAYMIFGRNRVGPAFFALYAVSLANRESAVFFGVWLLCYATAQALIERRYAWREAAIGIVLIIIAVAYVTTLRQQALIESTLGHETGSVWSASAIGKSGELHQALGNHLFLIMNTKEFFKNLVSTHFYVDILVIGLVLHGLILAKLGMTRRSAKLLAIGAFNLILLVCILNFAAVNETRLFLICVPFIVFSVVTFSSEITAFFRRVDRKFMPVPDRSNLNSI
jgi:hypothetical protein